MNISQLVFLSKDIKYIWLELHALFDEVHERPIKSLVHRGWPTAPNALYFRYVVPLDLFPDEVLVPQATVLPLHL